MRGKPERLDRAPMHGSVAGIGVSIHHTHAGNFCGTHDTARTVGAALTRGDNSSMVDRATGIRSAKYQSYTAQTAVRAQH